jgi:hypothetical protein
MRYREHLRRDVVRLSLPDAITSRHWIIYGPGGEGAFADSYREQVESRVRELAESHPTLQKLSRDAHIGEEDLEVLAKDLNRPVFDPNDHGKPVAPKVVTFKYFDEDFDDDSVGFVQLPVDDQEPFQPVDETGSSYKSRRVRDRAGQAVFRQKVLAAYGHRCCVTGESTLKVLDAAHI